MNTECLLYALAIYAYKSNPPLPKLQERRNDLPSIIHVNTEVQAWVVLAASTEDARKEGFKKAYEWWPESNGWSGHTVASESMDRAFLQEQIEGMSDTKIVDDEWPDRVG